MDQTMSRYISSTDELLVEEDDNMSDDIETAPAYEIAYNEDLNCVVVDSANDDFSLHIRGLGINSLPDYTGKIYESIVRMRQFQEDHGIKAEHRADVLGVDMCAPEPLNNELIYILDHEDDFQGIQLRTEISGRTYAFESGMERDEDDSDLFEMTLDRQINRLYQTLWDDFILDNVTLNEE